MAEQDTPQSNPFDVDGARKLFIDDRAVAFSIADQNKRRFAIEDALGYDPSLRDRAYWALSALQEQTLQAQIESGSGEVYAALAQRYEEIPAILAEISVKLTQAREEYEARKAEITRIGEALVMLAPPAWQEAYELASQKTQEALEETGVNELEREYYALKDEIRELESLYRLIAQPWPVPEAVIKILDDTELEAWGAEQLVLMSREVPRGTYSGVTHEVLDRNASRHAAEYLSMHRREIVRVEQLAQHMYKVDISSLPKDQEKDFRTRVTGILGPVRQTSEIQISVAALLAEGNMTLQLGWENIQTVNTLGRELPVKRRVYRAVPYKEFSKNWLEETELDGNRVIWQYTDEQAAIIEENKQAAQTPKQEAPAAQLDEVKDSGHDDEQRGELEGEQPRVVTMTTPYHPPEIAVGNGNGPQRQAGSYETSRVPDSAWVSSLRAKAPAIITKIEERGLAKRGNLIDDLLAGTGMDRNELLQKLRRNGIITGSKLKNEKITMADVVGLYYYQASPHLYEDSDRLTIMLSLARELTEDHFARGALEATA
jgi:hypothetical protein